MGSMLSRPHVVLYTLLAARDTHIAVGYAIVVQHILTTMRNIFDCAQVSRFSVDFRTVPDSPGMPFALFALNKCTECLLAESLSD